MSDWKRTMVVAGACMVASACMLAAANAPAAAPPNDLLSVLDVVPAEWGGIWNLRLENRKCSNDSLMTFSTVLDTICPSMSFPKPGSGGFTINCETTATATTFSSHCTGSAELWTGCTGTIAVDITGTRSGDTLTADGTTNIYYVGSCLSIPNSCTHLVETGTRTAPPPTPCSGSPVVQQTWGALKSLYR